MLGSSATPAAEDLYLRVGKHGREEEGNAESWLIAHRLTLVNAKYMSWILAALKDTKNRLLVNDKRLTVKLQLLNSYDFYRRARIGGSHTDSHEEAY